MRGGAVAARRAHNPKVAGSNPAPAIKIGTCECLFSFKFSGIRSRTYDPNVTSLTGWIILADELSMSIIFFGKSTIDCGNVSLPMWMT